MGAEATTSRRLAARPGESGRLEPWPAASGAGPALSPSRHIAPASRPAGPGFCSYPAQGCTSDRASGAERARGRNWVGEPVQGPTSPASSP
ncbi:hypothetical protein QYE76_052652 [Lolium multiflorum]|uniref:Uncharacterized protein n=1 Tax=Lolium multiflorum TaxID=4521 RepID=A0AAD8WL86_LOLMU|nr:hypothetical protein QYE76_052652 [Lolium multiflorum]